MTDWLGLFFSEIRATGFWQWTAVIFSVTEVFLAKANNKLLYPAGIVATIISFFLLVDVQLFAEAFLNLYYLVMSVYGWVYWIRKRNQPPVKISYATRNEWAITMAISLGGWLLLYVVLKNFTTSDVPVLDAFVSATAWAGMWLLARRKIENWILLNISNLVAIPLLFHKKLAMFSVLTVVLFVVAIFGYLQWRRIYRQNQSAQFAEAYL